MKKVAYFINGTGHNAHAIGIARVLHGENLDLKIVTLVENLPVYARFPSEERRSRYERALAVAAKESTEEFIEEMNNLGFSDLEEVEITGRFPEALTSWSDSQGIDLVVKQALSDHNESGKTSKGDIKFAKVSHSSILFANEAIHMGRPVLVGVAPSEDDDKQNEYCEQLIVEAHLWAKRLNSPLHIVTAWQVWGEHLLRSYSSSEEVEETSRLQCERIQAALDRLIPAAIGKDPTTKVHLIKGDPSRVLTGLVRVVHPNLVVVGSDTKSGLAGYLIGSTATVLLRDRNMNYLIYKRPRK